MYNASVRMSRHMDVFQPLTDLLVRVFIGWQFFQSGLTKIANFDTTITLFEYEYSVPLLSPEIAAYLGTAAELALPVLLWVGLATRWTALALFLFNIVAVISYPPLYELALESGFTQFSPGFIQHIVWGLLMLVTISYGPSKVSFDHFFTKNNDQDQYF